MNDSQKRDSEQEYLHTLFEKIPDIIIFKDEKGTWLKANEKALELFRINHIEYQGFTDRELAEFSEISNDVFDYCATSDEAAWLHGKDYRVQETLPMPNGTILTFDVIKIPTFHSNGKRKSLIVIGRDITNRKIMEEKLSTIGKVIESSTDGVIITDVNQTIIYVNPSFTLTTGYSESEVIGKSPRILSSGIHDSEFYHSMWKSIKKNGNWKGEIWNRKKNGKLYLEWLTIQSIKNIYKEITNYLAVFSDISEREKIRRDVTLAGQIQKQSLPKEISTESFLIQTIYEPFQYVSGDFYDYLWDKDKKVLSGYVIDVMGHGFSTALQTSAIRVLFRQAVHKESLLDQKLFHLNNESMKYFSDESFAGAISFEFNFKNKTLYYVSAGINYFIALTKKKANLIKVKGSFLGIFHNNTYNLHSLPFRSGDSFIFLSDGLLDMIPPLEIENCQTYEELLILLNKFVSQNERTDDASAVCIKIM